MTTDKIAALEEALKMEGVTYPLAFWKNGLIEVEHAKLKVLHEAARAHLEQLRRGDVEGEYCGWKAKSPAHAIVRMLEFHGDKPSERIVEIAEIINTITPKGADNDQ